MGGRGAKSGLTGQGGEVGGQGGSQGGVGGGNGGSGGGQSGGQGGGITGRTGSGSAGGTQGGSDQSRESRQDAQTRQGEHGGAPPRSQGTIGGVRVVRYNQVFGFGDGTSTGVHKTAEAVVYETPEGVKIIFPVEYDTVRQPISPAQILSAWNALPEVIRKLSAPIIEVVDYLNPRDPYWRQRYQDFTYSFATGGLNKISFYGCGSRVSTSRLVETMCHETGHVIDHRLGNYSEGRDWIAAMEADERVSGLPSPTRYGQNANAEDFAESIKMYYARPEWFAREFPNRRRLIMGILGSF